MEIAGKQGPDEHLITALSGESSLLYQRGEVYEGLFGGKVHPDAQCSIVLAVQIEVGRKVDSLCCCTYSFLLFYQRKDLIHIETQMQGVVALILLKRLMADSHFAGVIADQVGCHVTLHCLQQGKEGHDGHGRDCDGDGTEHRATEISEYVAKRNGRKFDRHCISSYW
ncbi:hypothetical protein SDC9_62829 [bioreactor metagenome]|uniref:Uncharacterized protein n=1 Tax=bioreactor metagenome TaxID=1076179 RepID=A0A644XK21_9ZZZZ